MITNRLIFLIFIITVLFLNSIFLAQMNNSTMNFFNYKYAAVNIEKIANNTDNITSLSYIKYHLIATYKNEMKLINPHNYSYILNPRYKVCGSNLGNSLT